MDPMIRVCIAVAQAEAPVAQPCKIGEKRDLVGTRNTGGHFWDDRNSARDYDKG